jgi:hypothetical protein
MTHLVGNSSPCAVRLQEARVNGNRPNRHCSRTFHRIPTPAACCPTRRLTTLPSSHLAADAGGDSAGSGFPHLGRCAAWSKDAAASPGTGHCDQCKVTGDESQPLRASCVATNSSSRRERWPHVLCRRVQRAVTPSRVHPIACFATGTSLSAASVASTELPVVCCAPPIGAYAFSRNPLACSTTYST